MRVAVLLYAYAGGVPASRQIARTLHEDLAFRVLAANRAPDFRTIRDCRSPHLDALRDLFVPVLRLCQRAGLVTLGHLALKCTQLKAHASTHTMTRDERMGKEEARSQTEVAAVLR